MVDITTGNSCSCSPDQSDSPRPNEVFVRPRTSSPPVLLQRRATVGKRRPALPVRSSSSEESLPNVTPKLTGTWCSPMLNRVGWMTSPPTFWFVAILPSHESGKTTWLQLLRSERYAFFGEQPELENLETLGQPPVWMLFQRIRVQNGGMATGTRNTLSSMNFVEELLLSTSFGGSIGTLSVWRLREVPLSSEQLVYGLPAIYRRIIGSLN